METFKIEFTVTILIYLTPITISEDFEVYRPKPPGEDGWIFGTDSFKIPASLCNQGGMSCAHFNARTKRACHCSCPYSAATFMFDRNDWRCLTNLRTREQLGYNPTHYFVFESERLNYPIRLVYFSDYRRLSLPLSLKNCRVDEGSSRYIGCKGSEVSFNNSKLFSIVPDGDPRDSPPYFLKVESAASNTKLLEGRIIKLGVVCNGTVNRWLLFKYAGNIKCLEPTLPPKTTTKPGERNLKLFPSQGTGMVGNTTPTRTGREKGSDDSSSSQGLIAGLTTFILAVFIIIGFFAYRRGYLTKLKKPKLPPKKRVKRDNTTSVNTQSTSGSRDGEDKYRTLDITQAWAGRKPNNPDGSDEEEIQPYATVHLSMISPLNDGRNGPDNNDIPLKTLSLQLRTIQEKRATGKTELGNSPYENTDHHGESLVTPVEYLFYQPRYENEAVDSECRNVVLRPVYDKLTLATTNRLPCEYDSLIREKDLSCKSRREDITDTEGEDNMNIHTLLEVPSSDERTPACSIDKKKNQENSLGKFKTECIENV